MNTIIQSLTVYQNLVNIANLSQSNYQLNNMLFSLFVTNDKFQKQNTCFLWEILSAKFSSQISYLTIVEINVLFIIALISNSAKERKKKL